MKPKNWQLYSSLCSILAVTALVMSLSGCGDDGNGPEKLGRVDGTVYLPFELAAALQPAAGVVVNLAGGDYTQNRTTAADGRFGFDDVPVRSMTLTYSPAACLADTQVAVSVLENDTVRVDVTLTGDVSGDCLSLPFAGAARMEIEAESNTAVLLYDTSVRPKPAVVVVDLSTGGVRSAEFDDIANVFDMAFVSSNLIVFNCFKTGSGYYMRFFDISTMSMSGADVLYTINQGSLAGRLAVTPTGSDVFVTHRVQSGFTFDGQIFCVSVVQRNLQDADDDIPNLNFAFDHSLVQGSINWPYDVAIDPARNELLVGNYRDTLVIAIDYTLWGTFDRAANLIAPIMGVRKIVMATGTPGFAPWFWNFAGGRGVAAWPGSGEAPLLAYESGGATFSQKLVDPGVTLSSGNHHLTIHSARGTWYTLVTDPNRPQSVREAIEERSLTALSKSARFETRFSETPALDPRAFAVNTQTNRVYVAYTNKAILEVFELQ